MLGLSQLFFDFTASPKRAPIRSLREFAPAPEPKRETEQAGVRDEELESQAGAWLEQLGMPGARKLLRVEWNARLRSTAGYAHYPHWRIELNPRLREFDGQVERTLKHELAHLIAYHRSGRRIEPHGAEWRLACADLGIPGERARHTLPLPRKEVARKLVYVCPGCQQVTRRVKKFRGPVACRVCCNAHAGGEFDARFKFRLVSKEG
ncbi:MAG: SprT-like domain-containing protein [Verrucomicrobiaceae bacterium]|jgi:SprT protein|nr:SprT-like domain-containing protein [Verrucomicrobiaceae bacterium]